MMAKKISQDWQNSNVSFGNPFAGLRAKDATSASEEVFHDGVQKNEVPKAATATQGALPAGPPERGQDVVSGPSKATGLRLKYARLERARRGGKQVTVIGFVQSDDASREAWLKEVQKRFGIGGSLEEEQVILQGDQRERLDEVFQIAKKDTKQNKIK